MTVVHDIHRPDVNGVPPKMLAIAQKAQEELKGAPVGTMQVEVNDNIMSSVWMFFTYLPRDKWVHGIRHNGLAFNFSITPMKGKRYYSPDDPMVTVKLQNLSHKIKGKFRKYTGPVDKCIEKVKDWIEENKPEEV